MPGAPSPPARAAMRAFYAEQLPLQELLRALTWHRDWLVVAANGGTKVIDPAGAIAGLMARTDSNRGVWKAPAGSHATLIGALGISAAPSDEDVEELSRLGINCIRYSPSHGLGIWSARTLQGPDPFVSEWKYIPVRRTALYIEESIYRGLDWTVSEPNDEPLWAQIRLNVGAFMETMFEQGALQGTSSHQAYFVKCDSETNSQADIDQGTINLLVGFALLRPAEFVMIKIGLER